MDTKNQPIKTVDIQNQPPLIDAIVKKPKKRLHIPKFVYLLIALLLLLILMEGGAYLYKNSNKSIINFCTQEVKLCPDGVTYVSRHGPKCEFSKCPNSNNISASEEFDNDDGSNEEIVEKTPTPFPTPEINPKTGWKIFKMPDFTISTPTEFNLDTYSSTDDYVAITNYDVNTAPGRDFNPIEDKGLLKIEIVKLDTDKTFEEYFKDFKETKIINLKSGLSVHEVIGEDGPGIGYPSYFIKKTNNEEFYIIHFWLDFQNYPELRDNILSTFQFKN
jgi:hypothetical protein